MSYPFVNSLLSVNGRCEELPMTPYARTIRYLIGFAAFIFTAMPLLRLPTPIGPIYVYDLLLIGAWGFVLLDIFDPKQRMVGIPRKYQKIQIDRLMNWLLIWIMVGGFGIISSLGIVPVVYTYTRLALAIGVFFLVRRHFYSRQQLDVLVKVIVLGGLFGAVLALFQIYAPQLWSAALLPIVYYPNTDFSLGQSGLFWNEGLQAGLQRAYGGFYVPTTFGGVQAIVFILGLYRVWYRSASWSLPVGLIGLSVFLSWSRHAFIIVPISLFIAFMFQSIWNDKTKKLHMLYVSVIIVASSFLIYFIPFDISSTELTTNIDPEERLRSIFQPWTDTSFRARIDKYPLLVEYIFSDPSRLMIGVGHTYLQFSHRYTELSLSSLTARLKAGFASNSWLLYLHNHGLIVFLLICTIFISVANLLSTNFRKLTGETKRYTFFNFATLFAVFLAGNADNYVQQTFHVQSLMWITLGILVTMVQTDKVEPYGKEKPATLLVQDRRNEPMEPMLDNHQLT